MAARDSDDKVIDAALRYADRFAFRTNVKTDSFKALGIYRLSRMAIKRAPYREQGNCKIPSNTIDCLYDFAADPSR